MGHQRPLAARWHGGRGNTRSIIEWIEESGVYSAIHRNASYPSVLYEHIEIEKPGAKSFRVRPNQWIVRDENGDFHARRKRENVEAILHGRDEPSSEKEDGNPVDSVYRILRQKNIKSERAWDIINDILDAGIVFRERTD